MHNLNVGVDVLAEFPSGAEVFDYLAGSERCRPAVVDVYAVGRRCGQLVPVERSVACRDDRPRVRIGRRLTGEITCLELGDGGFEVVGVEYDARCDPVVVVDLDDGERCSLERLGQRASACEAEPTEGKALSAGRNHGRRYIRSSRLHWSPAS